LRFAVFFRVDSKFRSSNEILRNLAQRNFEFDLKFWIRRAKFWIWFKILIIDNEILNLIQNFEWISRNFEWSKILNEAKFREILNDSKFWMKRNFEWSEISRNFDWRNFAWSKISRNFDWRNFLLARLGQKDEGEIFFKNRNFLLVCFGRKDGIFWRSSF
jgi:hypothetical protein